MRVVTHIFSSTQRYATCSHSLENHCLTNISYFYLHLMREVNRSEVSKYFRAQESLMVDTSLFSVLGILLRRNTTNFAECKSRWPAACTRCLINKPMDSLCTPAINTIPIHKTFRRTSAEVFTSAVLYIVHITSLNEEIGSQRFG